MIKAADYNKKDFVLNCFALGIPSTRAQDKFRVNPFLFRKDCSPSTGLRINSKPAPFLFRKGERPNIFVSDLCIYFIDRTLVISI
jgi:hypothetical protein